ncbi:MAG: LysM peptidoglycan-binding domain-containing protein [Saprospiraceae bacterium]|nr:LysM peptidoglycan-binding domain-containing protein [Saprospiraceae bacterium]
MSLQDKYRSVLDLGESLGIKGGNVSEADGVLKVWGTAETQYEKDQLWDKIKEVGGANPTDLVADISVANTDYYAKHTVKSGESLSKIAKHYYDNASAYNKIFQANKDILKDPDVIHPGQQLTIPNA